MINPHTMTAPAWTSRMTPFLSNYGQVPILRDEAGWPAWAAVVCGFPALAALHAPGPTGFATWQDWARNFSAAIETSLAIF